jgi:hypothetical protein
VDDALARNIKPDTLRALRWMADQSPMGNPVITWDNSGSRINELLARREREEFARLAQDPDNFEPATLVWLLGDIVVLEGDKWVSVVDQRPVDKELVHKYGRVLRHDPTATPADEYDANAIHPR